MKSILQWALLCAGIFSTLGVGKMATALSPTPEEMMMKDRWFLAKFENQAMEMPTSSYGIFVIQNHDFVRRNYGLGGKLKIQNTVYESGIMAHAYSKLRIVLPQPGKQFTSFIGIDNNNDRNGSVQFFVKDASEALLYQSEKVLGNEAPIAIQVDLNNATEFILEVDPLEDISCDQSLWADAKIELADGSFIRLGDMEVLNESAGKTYELDYPFSFVYNGQSSREFLKNWDRKSTTETIDENKVLHTYVFTEPNGALQVTCAATEYLDFPTVEWVLRFKNISDHDTPIIENIQAIDSSFSVNSFSKNIENWDLLWGEPVQKNSSPIILHHFFGSPCQIIDYMPLQKEIQAGENVRIATEGGRGTNSNLPYFNVQLVQEGWIVVLGWPGQWASSFQSHEGKTINVVAGQELTHFKLIPGEEVRSPLAVVQPWKREQWIDSQNVWRAWMIKHNVPRDPSTGEVVDHHIAGCSSNWYAEMGNADTQSQLDFINRYLEEKIPLDYWWMDAGWYPCGGNWPETGGFWPNTGTWETDPVRFPQGFRPITDYNHRNGIKNLLWFEPERVTANTWLTLNHPEWVLGGADCGLLNLSDPEVVDWLIDHIDAFLEKEGIDLYRQDFNMDPLSYWRNNDAPDRQGITEIKHIEGYLRFWDTLLARNPGLRIDSCASGGRRNDLETMRRSVPLWRSDFMYNACAKQCHMYGISHWIPFSGTGYRSLDVYGLRSAFASYGNYLYDLRDRTIDYDMIRENTAIWHDVVMPCFRTDYYPLTPPSTENDQWLGWQWNNPEKGTGLIQMFRRPESVYVEGAFSLHNLDPNAEYEFRDIDSGKTWKVNGQRLMNKGFLVEINEVPAAVLITYQKVN